MSSASEENKVAKGGRLGLGHSQWKLQLPAALRSGAKEFQDIILKVLISVSSPAKKNCTVICYHFSYLSNSLFLKQGGGMLTFTRIFQLV